MNVAAALARVVDGQHLSADEMADVVRALVADDEAVPPAQVGALLVALRRKGETVDEVVGAAVAMRQLAVAPLLPAEDPTRPLVDTCGTGGDGSGSVNISTLAALVAAAGGLRVAKHGNRALSSRSGSADLIEGLGIDPSPSPAATGRALAELGFGFYFAPRYHPATGKVAAIRRQLGVRTIFNWLGPLSNPAQVRHHVVGVYAQALLLPMAEALKRLGSVRALVVHGHGGLDEIAPHGPTAAVELIDGEIVSRQLDPRDFGVEPAAQSDLGGGDPVENVARARSLLGGQERGAARTAVILAAGAAYYIAGRGSLRDGAAWASAIVDEGRALRLIDQLRGLTPAPEPQ